MKKIVVGITGASGSIYAKRLIEVLASKQIKTQVVVTDQGKAVFEYELSLNFDTWFQSLKSSFLKLEDNKDLFSDIASGSNKIDGMVILPCSMGTLGKISHGISDNLLCRGADVTIKEHRKLILVPRETPLSTIHLENLWSLSKMGVIIIPAMPGFYNKPQTLEEIVDFMVGKILDNFGIENTLYKKWKGITHEN